MGGGGFSPDLSTPAGVGLDVVELVLFVVLVAVVFVLVMLVVFVVMLVVRLVLLVVLVELLVVLCCKLALSSKSGSEGKSHSNALIFYHGTLVEHAFAARNSSSCALKHRNT